MHSIPMEGYSGHQNIFYSFNTEYKISMKQSTNEE